MGRYRVAIVAPPWYRVPPVGYGGIELVVDLLVRTLRERGIEVFLYANAGSQEALPLAPAHWTADLGHEYQIFREVTYVARVLKDLRKRRVDVIHEHSGAVGVLAHAFQDTIPALHTVHGPIYEPQRTMYEAIGEHLGLVAISDHQRDSAAGLNWAGRVYNAVDVDALRVGTTAAEPGYLVCLARISPEKGQAHAIAAAKRAGMKLILAGKVGERDSEHRYFEEEISPHIDGDRVRYLHNVAGAEKAELLAGATALLAPLDWPEPFGLAMAEAMASGTPVLAFGQGAALELVEPGVTGFIVRDVEEMAAAVASVRELDRGACARRARARFSPDAMADGYLRLYRALSPVKPAEVGDVLAPRERTFDILGGRAAGAVRG